jgi:hypothetical protein
MPEPIEHTYFNWLCAKVQKHRSSHIYRDLLWIVHTTEFTWVLPEDKNRAEDGVELRLDFLRESRVESESQWFSQPCSVLEVLVAFANRASFQTDIPVRDWFWKLMDNLDLGEYRQVSRSDEIYIREKLHTFIWRTYDPSGYGGLFPMRWPKSDQRKVEIWYQFFEYLEDQGLI